MVFIHLEQSHSLYLQRSKATGLSRQGRFRFVGSSAKNSHHFLNHTTTMRERTNGDREFRFYVDGVLIKRVLKRRGVDLVKLECTKRLADRQDFI